MKNKIYRSIALLFVAVLSTACVIAQPGYHKDDNDRKDDRRYDKEDRRYDNDRRDDRDGRYNDGHNKNQNRDYCNNDRDYRQYQVRHRPTDPRYEQSRRPSPNHVWIPGDWVYNRGQYSFQPGEWVMPNRGKAYVPGHWERVRHGWYWVPGYWDHGNRRL